MFRKTMSMIMLCGKQVQVKMAGVDEFVMKPFTSEILIEKLKLIGVQCPAAA
jgi:DNA-binding response OmpR family regulator